VEIELLARGAQPGQLVAVLMEKGWEQVAGVLGILFAGAAYLPVDSDLPGERQRYLIENGEVKIVLTQSSLHRADGLPAEVQQLDVDRMSPSGAPEPIARRRQRRDDLAYVIYTSGSTGVPKGVIIDHRGAVNTVLDINQRFGVGPGDRVLALSRLNFDLSVYDIFGVLAAGGTIVMPAANSRHGSGALGGTNRVGESDAVEYRSGAGGFVGGRGSARRGTLAVIAIGNDERRLDSDESAGTRPGSPAQSEDREPGRGDRSVDLVDFVSDRSGGSDLEEYSVRYPDGESEFSDLECRWSAFAGVGAWKSLYRRHRAGQGLLAR
jgi:hypothetical protein